ncbi:MAG: Ig-like domain-containing protein [Treponema sp.]|nr:Ig-like domain-containing protein [Treponema sp.]
MRIVRFLTFTALAALLFAACESPTDPPPVVLTGITVTPKEKIIIVDETFQLTAVKNPADAVDAIEWVSSDPAKVTVTGGEIKGIAVTATPVTITAKSKTNAVVFDTCTVTVAAERKALTGIAVYPGTRSISVNEEFQLAAERTPQDGTDDIEWVSSDPAKVTVTETGKIKGIAAADTPVTITVKSKANAEISGTCQVTVTSAPPTYELKLIHNAAVPGTYDDSPATTSIPPLEDNRYVINSYFGELGGTAPTGNFNTSGGFVDTTFFYVDHLFEGDFKISARVKFTKTPPSNSTSKGIIIGGIAPESDTSIPGKLSNVGGVHFRTSGGSGATPYAVRSVASKATEQASVAGLNESVGKEDEYIFEVSRTADGYTTSFKVGKTGDPVATATVDYTDRVVVADTSVFVGFALMAVEAEISQIKVWDGNLEGNPVFSTPDSTPRPVPVAGVTIGVPSGMTTTGAGTAAEPQELIVRYGDVPAGGIQLSPIVTPSYADELGVDYYLASTGFTNDATITVSQTTGLVSVTGAGTATIQMISRDTAEPEAYLTITVTPDYVPVGVFNITGGMSTITEEGTTTFTTDIPATVTDPVIVWTSSDAGTVTIIDSENKEVSTFTGPAAKIKGLKAGTATITATATTTSAGTPTVKNATLAVTVEAITSNVILKWDAGEGKTFALSAPVYMAPDGTILSDITNLTAGVHYFTLVGRDSGITATATGIVLAGKRFNIGTAYNDNGGQGGTDQDTSSSVNVPDGQFNFSKKVKITIAYSAYTGTKTAYLYINNNTSGGTNSVLGSTAAIQYTPVSTGGEYTYTLYPTDFSNQESLSHAFIQIRTQSDTSITITGITIEYVAD